MRRIGLFLAVITGLVTTMNVRSAASSAQRFEVTKLALPVDPGAQPHVGAVCFDGQRWWLAGSVFTPGAPQRPGLSGALSNVDGVHRPALWSSLDALTWTVIPTEARTGYGEVSELYALACNASGLVAIGAATGGAHGNPRTVTWALAGNDVLREVAADFELYNGPRQIGVQAVTATPTGWVILGTRVNRNERMGATSWTSASGDDFVIHDDDPALSAQQHEQTQGLAVATVGNQLLGVGERFFVTGSNPDTDAIVWMSGDGASWSRWTPSGLRLGGPGAQRAQQIAATNGRILIAGTETNDTVSFIAWTKTPTTPWRKTTIAALGRSDDVLSTATAATVWNRNYVIGTRTGTDLRVVTSTDARTWTRLNFHDVLPAGERARLAFASAGDTLVIGARSETDGGAWIVRERNEA